MSGDDYLRRNRDYWNHQAAWYAERASDAWTQDEPTWGIWGIPERDVGMLRSVAAGMDALEDGCGTGYVSAWMARRGARVVGLDNSPAQLATAWQLRREHGVGVALVHGAGERLPFADESFDFVISEYGAAIWADPHAWIPEAARVLRRGGELVFLLNSLLLMLCMPERDADLPTKRELVRDQRGLYRFDWPDDGNTEFHLSHGDWIRLFRANDLAVEELLELYPPPDAATRYPFVTLEWARRWPSEEVWRVRKR
ncbi:MAG TPA: class I SAM-dependent methyltransferase [Thermoanaerobaculia bacterium]|nr:class I SAM-dependent methyltransferase [Thermoanaerobaculia bacterium]